LTAWTSFLLHREMKRSPNPSAGKAASRAQQQQRLAQALRENLRRRKLQARAQADIAGEPDRPAPALSGGPVSTTNDRRGGTTAD
jgi:hypothetical protein